MNKDVKMARLHELTDLLSEAARVYEQEDREIMSNFEYDRLYDELLALEKETGVVLSQSPTHKVGYEVASELPKERHASPMLSLNKTKSREELADWLGDHKGVLSWKMDGLTVVLTYEGGELVKAVTRGNGETGEIVTANARTFKNLPARISYRGRLILRGEAVIRYSDFEKINASIPETESRYKNPRNLCSGSVRQLDSSVTAVRNVRLYAFALISMQDMENADDGQSPFLVNEGEQLSFFAAEGEKKGATVENKNTAEFATRHEQLDFLASLGFEVVERVLVDKGSVADTVEIFSKKIPGNDFPSDGLVLMYDDIAYGNSLGRTAKFPRDAIAFKWADEQAETVLREVEWSASRTGLINPVAIFDPVELEGTTVSRASLHNISIMEELQLGIGDHITVYKANMIIPQIADNLTKSGTYRIYEPEDHSMAVSCPEPCADQAEEDTLNAGTPMEGIPIENSVCIYINPVVAKKCPVCGVHTIVRNENDVRTLICPNPDCAAKKIKLFALAVSRDALNIEGLSESTVEKFVDAGIIRETADIFRLSQHRELIESMEGFGKKSCDNLLEAIEKARSTTLDRVIYCLGIPNIGLANARLIAKYAGYDPVRIPSLTESELSGIDQIGPVLAGAFTAFFEEKGAADTVFESSVSADTASGDTVSGSRTGRQQYEDLVACLNLTVPQINTENGAFAGKTFVITGSVEHFANRNEAKAFIESKGGKVTGSVTKNTDYLVNNDINSTSTKNKTARDLGVPIISEEELLTMGQE